MRTIWLLLLAIQFGVAGIALAQDSSDADHSLSEKLPLFSKNHCSEHKDPANQLFCGDAELSAAGEKLSEAIQGRLSRLADRRMAVEENAEWVKERNLSCGIFGNDPVHFEDIDPIIACLLKETEERIAILRNPNFDCLARRTRRPAA